MKDLYHLMFPTAESLKAAEKGKRKKRKPKKRKKKEPRYYIELDEKAHREWLCRTDLGRVAAVGQTRHGVYVRPINQGTTIPVEDLEAAASALLDDK